MIDLMLIPRLLLIIIMGIATSVLPATTLLAAAPPWAAGATNVLVIMVQFPADAADPDGAQPAVNCSFTAAQMQANLFGASATGPGNMADYYNEVSFGALNLNGTVVGCFTVANDKNDYDDGPLGASNLVNEAVALADPTVDFSAFDNDGDGAVDNVAIVYAGGGPDNSVYLGANPNNGFNRLWPHASNIAPVAVDGGARTVSQYYIAPELLNNTPRIRTIGVYAHEFGHKLGLPDLYDTDNSSSGIGHWGLMGSGSWNSNNPGIENGEAPAHLSAWSKWFLGWITPTNLTGVNVLQNIPQAETNPVAIQLLTNPGGPDDWPGGTGEYFLIENRQQTAFDVGLDGCGILTWHIDEARSNNASEGHTGANHRLLDLEEANPPPEQLDQQDFPGPGNRGDGGDPFRGTSNNAQFDDTTTPHSRLYDGSNTGIQMSVASTACADPMQVRFGPNLPPTADANGPYTEECQGDTTAVQLDGTGSSDPENDPLIYAWGSSCVGGTFDDASLSQPTLTVDTSTLNSPINCNVDLTVTDSAADSDSDTSTVTLQDTIPPNITCPANQLVECTGPAGAPVTFPTPVATDTCSSSPATLCSPASGTTFPLGETTDSCTATDGSGNQSSCDFTVEVVDTTPPVIESVQATPSVLWPPNHKMVMVSLTVQASDLCSETAPICQIISVDSNEPVNGPGDGDTDSDWTILNPDSLLLALRSERSGKGDGRIYTVTVECSDAAGNSATAPVAVTVPHDRRKK